LGERPLGELELFGNCIPQDSYGRFSAGRAKSLVPVKSLIGFSMRLAQRFNLLHFAVVFFPAGKELQQLGFKQFVRMGRPGK
jgi:hypothetical protein